MPLTDLSYGYEKPSNPTTGDVWFPAMERNIQRMNDHTHDGDNGARIAAETASISSGAWGSDLGGSKYRKLLTLPAGFTFDAVRIEVRRSTGEMVYPTIEKVSSTTFYLYTNSNALTYTVSYI